ncbi:hypothetical protein YC2023_081450 [Brassica napus]
MMCFVSCVCLDESLYVGTCSESVNGAKAGQNDSQEPSSSKDLSLVIANEPEEKPPEQSGEPSLLVLDKEILTCKYNVVIPHLHSLLTFLSFQTLSSFFSLALKMSSSQNDKKNSDAEMAEASSQAQESTPSDDAPTCVVGFLSFREKMSRRKAEKETARMKSTLAVLTSSTELSDHPYLKQPAKRTTELDE